MKRDKDFDCVEMKWQIQRKIEEKYRGVPEDEARDLQWEAALKDPILGPFLSRLRAREKTSASK